jgi:vesicular inhibitory amino acid transporter
VAFRSLVVLVLLFVCATMPNFSMFLDLVGGSTVTLLTFVFPPFFYMRLVDSSSQNPAWEQRCTCLMYTVSREQRKVKLR